MINTFRSLRINCHEHFLKIIIFIILCNPCEFNFDSIFNVFFYSFSFILINKRTCVVQIALLFENHLQFYGKPYLAAVASSFALSDAGISGGGGRGMPKHTLTPS